MFDLSSKVLLQIMADGIKTLYFFSGGLVLIVKFVFLFDELFHFRLQCLVARQLLESLGIEIAFGSIQYDEVAVMIITIF